MTLLYDIARGLLGMFLADARLSIAILALVSFVATLILKLGVDPPVGGIVLLVGSLAILVEAAFRETRRRRQL